MQDMTPQVQATTTTTTKKTKRTDKSEARRGGTLL
jgi:hypothetical protein